MSEIFIYLTIILNAVLGFLIYFRNRKSAENLYYALFVIFLDFWILTNFLENEPDKVGLDRLELFLRLDFVFGALFMYAWLKFCIILGSQAGYRIKGATWIGWISAAIAIAFVPLTLFTPLVVNNVEFHDSIIHFKDGILFLAYAIFILACAVCGPLVLFRIRKFALRMSNESLAKNIRMILIGFLVSLGNAVVINLLQPFLNLSLEVSRAGIYGLTILVVCTAYAIVRYRFLNIKVIAIETFAISLVLFSALQIPDKDLPYILPLRIGIFIGTLVASIFIVRSVRKEVKQREELQLITKKLAEANRTLEELSRFKSQLLSIASHQIKSPLAIIKGYLTILLQGLYGPVDGKVRETLEKVKKSADELTSLIESLLNLRKAEEGKMDYKFAPVDLGVLVSGVIEGLRVLAYQKGLVLDYTAPPAPITVEADSQKLHEVLQNLVDNSIKYTPQGFVRATVEKVGNKARISVRDSGLGISPELLPRLFGEFVRDERVRKSIKGTGFGLYVAKKIIDAHGGRIWAESEGEGKGSAFFVELPLEAKR